MAAEIHETTPAEAPAITDSEAAAKPNEISHDAGPDAPSYVNGTAATGHADEITKKHITDIVDNLVNSAEPSISGGSDTDTSRLDASKSKDEDKGHVRTSSTTRKPATFKAVSVNKTFLAAKAAGAAAASKPGDKQSPILGSASLSTTPSASAKPRLVAKTGLVKSSSANGRPAAAPDPNVVWNKNRPPPVQDPKKFTDEELKKYGIHMASRLQQQDVAKGQANWADIDDDDDDWAPEEIRWTDGTKTTIPHHDENNPMAQSEQPSQSAPEGFQGDRYHTQIVAPQPATIAPITLLSKDTSTIEKPKSPALAPAPAPPPSAQPPRPSGLPSGRGLILKVSQDKPTLVAKPPAPPTPAKSPWASLPPIDKAPPTVIDQPPPVGPSRLPHHSQPFHHPHPQRDVYGGPPVRTTPPPPLKEIAADDFSRGGFKDSHPHNRELFNSQSGRLEPVMDRRGSGARSDMQHYRQTPAALLQRHGMSSDQPPEPSLAFQTHRSSAQDGPYGRRRNSSNVSGHSVGFMHRMGRPGEQHMPLEHYNAGQPPLTGRSDSPGSLKNVSSGPRPWQPRSSPTTNFAGPHGHTGPEAHFQHAVSDGHSSATGPVGAPTAPAAPSAPVAPAAATTPVVSAAPAAGPVAPVVATVAAENIEQELELQKKIMRERRELAKKRRLEEEAREEAAKRERIRLKLEAMGPAPERKSAKKEAPSKEETNTAALPGAAASSPSSAEAGGSEKKLASAVEVVPNVLRRPKPATEEGGASDEAKTAQAQSWKESATPRPERIASWTSSNQSNRNVWGSPNNNNRSLGNGTFNSDLVRGSDPYSQPVAPIGGAPAPGPIGPPPMAPKAATSAPSETIATITPPVGPIGPAKPAAAAGMGRSTDSARSAWANAVKASDNTALLQQKAHRAEQQREVEARGMMLQDLRPSIKDTWMPTRLSEEGDRIEDKSSRSVVHRTGGKAADGASGASGPPAATLPPPPQTRPSRFFPTRDIRLEEGYNAAPTTQQGPRNAQKSGSPSPPPPDTDGHPAFDGDAARPTVSLPRPRPQVVVRFPLKGAGASSDDGAATSANQRHTQTTQKPKEGGSWQARFDNLLNRKGSTSPTKPGSSNGLRATDSGSMLNSPPLRSPQSPTVPQQQQQQPMLRVTRIAKPAPKEAYATRPMAEECFEKQEMGSLPPVNIPHTAPAHAWTPALVPKPLARRFFTMPTSREHEGFLKDSFGASYIVSIHLPGMPGAAKTVHLPSTRTHSNPRRSYGRGRGGGGGSGNGSGSGSGGGNGNGGNNSSDGNNGIGGEGGNAGNSGDHSGGSTAGGGNSGNNVGSGGSEGSRRNRHRGGGSSRARDATNAQTGSYGDDRSTAPSLSRGGSSGRSRGGGLRHRSENWTRSTPAPVQS